MVDINYPITKLSSIIRGENLYIELYMEYIPIYKRNGTIYQYCTPEGLELTRIQLKEIPFKSSTFLDILLEITRRFSIFLGYSNQEWKEMVSYLFHSNARVTTPEKYSEGTISDKTIDLLLQNPYVVTLLLFELLDATISENFPE